MFSLILWFALCFPAGMVLGLIDFVVARQFPAFGRKYRLTIFGGMLVALSLHVSTYEIIRVPMLPRGEDFAVCLFLNGSSCLLIAELLLKRLGKPGGGPP